MQIERIKFERTGGFAGIRIATDVKLNDLPDDQAQTISALIDDLDFGELPPELMKNDNMPDQFTYKITVETETWQHTVVTGDASAPEKLQELLQLLNRLARTQKRQ
jgi:emfourin